MENFLNNNIICQRTLTWTLTFIVEFKQLLFNWPSVDPEQKLIANLALGKPWPNFFPAPYPSLQSV